MKSDYQRMVFIFFGVPNSRAILITYNLVGNRHVRFVKLINI